MRAVQADLATAVPVEPGHARSANGSLHHGDSNVCCKQNLDACRESAQAALLELFDLKHCMPQEQSALLTSVMQLTLALHRCMSCRLAPLQTLLGC